MKTGCSENIPKWLARDCTGNKAESSVAVVLNSLSTWTLFTAKAWAYPDYQDQKERELPSSSWGILQKIRRAGLEFFFINHIYFEVNFPGTQCRYHLRVFYKIYFCFFVPSPEHFFGVNMLPRIIIALMCDGRGGRRNGKSCIQPFCKGYELWQPVALAAPCQRSWCTRAAGRNAAESLHLPHCTSCKSSELTARHVTTMGQQWD